jgi:hypothetical protein
MSEGDGRVTDLSLAQYGREELDDTVDIETEEEISHGELRG